VCVELADRHTLGLCSSAAASSDADNWEEMGKRVRGYKMKERETHSIPSCLERGERGGEGWGEGDGH
jgi:hypothetical protein